MSESFRGYPNLSPVARAAVEQFITTRGFTWLQGDDYKSQHTDTGRAYRAAAIVRPLVELGCLPDELQVVADCLRIS